MSGRRALKCLICEDAVSAKKLLEHICAHIEYSPHKCSDCSFKSVERNELLQHTLDTNHLWMPASDPYKQWLLESITQDIQFADMYGVHELLRNKRLGISIPTVPTPSPSTSRPRDRQPAPRPRSPTPELVSSDEEEELPRRATKQTPPKKVNEPKKSGDNKQTESVGKPKKNSEEGESEDGAEKEDKIVKFRRELANKYARCNLCRKNIPFSLRHRMDHIKDEHADNWETEKLHPKQTFEEFVEAKTGKAFPGLLSSPLECAYPCCGKTIHTTGGRSGHVITYHKHYFKPLACPKGCGFESLSERDFTTHFMEKHGTPKNWRLFIDETDFITEMNLHKRKIEQVVDLLFTVPFSKVPVKRRRSGVNDDDDEDEEDTRKELAAIKAAAPSRRTGPPVQKRRRSKSVSSEEDEDDSDEEQAVSGKGKASSKNGDDSDKANDDEVDDKDQAKNGSTASSSCAIVDSNGNSPNKTAAAVKTEDEIKEEPVTPTTSPSTGFTGRRLPPVLTKEEPAVVKKETVAAPKRKLAASADVISDQEKRCEEEHKKTLFLKGFDRTYDDDEIKALHALIIDVRRPWRNGKFAFAKFASEANANKAYCALSKVKGLTVNWYVDKKVR